MSKRKPRYEGPAYCDYQDLFDRITTELENLYHTLWDKRKESPKFRTMGKQAKTAWMLWKLGSMEYWRREGEGLHFTNQIEERRKSHIIYVRAKFENDPTDLDEWDETLDEYLCKVRHNKAKNLMMPYLARTIIEWRDGRTLYYSGLLTAMNTELMVIPIIARPLSIWKKLSGCCMKLKPILARMMRKKLGLPFSLISGNGTLGGMIKLHIFES